MPGVTASGDSRPAAGQVHSRCANICANFWQASCTFLTLWLCNLHASPCGFRGTQPNCSPARSQSA
jgi:hypothetical protein